MFLKHKCSNNTNKLSPQEQEYNKMKGLNSSNNTNKLSPQELHILRTRPQLCSNNTNKLSPQERELAKQSNAQVQIIQINLVLKNRC